MVISSILPQKHMNKIDPLRQRFITGNNSQLQIDHCPANWHTLLTSQPPETLPINALGLLSHCQALSEFPQPPQNLEQKPLLPLLDLPPLPKHLHSNFKQVFQYDTTLIPEVLYFLAARGYSLPVHFWREIPLEVRHYLPKLYQPWLNYQKEALIYEKISATNWDSYAPAARLVALRELRQEDPSAFRALLEECLEREKSSHRLAIIQLFEENLSEEDKPFLQTLRQSRAKKIAERVENLLLILEPPPKTAAEMAEKVAAVRAFFQFSLRGGNGKKKPTIDIMQRKMTPEQQQERQKIIAYLRVVNLKALAQSFKLSLLEMALAICWKRFSFTEVQHFIARILTALSPADALVFQESIFELISNIPRYTGRENISQWSSFLSPEKKLFFIVECIKDQKKEAPLVHCLYLNQCPLPKGSLTLAELKRGVLWHMIKYSPSFYEVFLLGLLLPAEIAQEALPELEMLAKPQHRDALSSLRLNIALPE